MTRRRLLGDLGIGTLTIFLPLAIRADAPGTPVGASGPGSASSLEPGSSMSSSNSRNASEQGELALWHEVGRKYLDQYPGDRGVEASLRSLLRTKPLGLPGSAEQFRRIREGVARDFEARRIVVVDGWILSRTEARLAALTVILSR